MVLEETPFLWFHRCFGWILFLKCLSQKHLLTETAGPFQFSISLWTIAGPRLMPHAGTRSPRDPRASYPLAFTGAVVDRLRPRGRWIPMAALQGSQLCRLESRCPQTVVNGALPAICCLRLYLHCDTRHLVIKHGKTQHSSVGDSSPRECQSFLCLPDVARVFCLAKTQTRESHFGET